MVDRVFDAHRPWPGSARAAVAITFDVDAESALLGANPANGDRLGALSEARYGVVRGLPRILDLLDHHDVPGTFYVPGDTAERHPAALERLVGSHHEVAHHGHLHLRSDIADVSRQREEIELGLDALNRRFGMRPRGYRSPTWELTPATFALLIEHGFDYDSSCMGDDRPYLETHNGRSILELPVHWSLDDWPHFGWSAARGGTLAAPSAVLEMWIDEFENTVREGRLMTLTMHPEIIGRGYRVDVVARFLEHARARSDVWFATHAQIADHVTTDS